MSALDFLRRKVISLERGRMAAIYRDDFAQAKEIERKLGIAWATLNREELGEYVRAELARAMED